MKFQRKKMETIRYHERKGGNYEKTATKGESSRAAREKRRTWGPSIREGGGRDPCYRREVVITEKRRSAVAPKRRSASSKKEGSAQKG